MASSISYEYLQSIKGVADGLATLDSGGKIPTTQLPSGAVETYKGIFADVAALTTAYPTAATADYAYINSSNSFYYWNDALTTPNWVNQNITPSAYLALTTIQRSQLPYIIIP